MHPDSSSHRTCVHGDLRPGGAPASKTGGHKVASPCAALWCDILVSHGSFDWFCDGILGAAGPQGLPWHWGGMWLSCLYFKF